MNAPKNSTFLITLVLFALGILGYLVKTIPFVSAHCYWFVVAGYVLLALSVKLKGL
jgi:hypothetical protein